jgi:Zn-dependent peptidase ImmA (M78 family)
MTILGKGRGKPISRIQFNAILKRFIVFLKRELTLTIDIPYILIDDADFSKKNGAFGMMNSDGVIYISIINRHPMDILRTLAHEYVHYKQSIKGVVMKSNPGSPAENQANAKAGEIMRKYGKLHPELFDLMSIR